MIYIFTTLIYAFSKFHQFHHTLATFSQMLTRGLKPNNRAFPSVAKACVGLSALKPGRQVHGIATNPNSLKRYIESLLLVLE